MNDIAIELSYRNKQFVARLHFNLIKMSATIKDQNLDVFCQKLARELRSTSNKVTPLSGKSSNEISRFDPSSVSIHHDEEHPINGTSAGLIQIVISEFINEKVEFAKLFEESQHTET